MILSVCSHDTKSKKEEHKLRSGLAHEVSAGRIEIGELHGICQLLDSEKKKSLRTPAMFAYNLTPPLDHFNLPALMLLLVLVLPLAQLTLALVTKQVNLQSNILMYEAFTSR